MIDVFLSYRRKSGSEAASFINAYLSNIEEYEVFFDAKSLRSGPFDERIESAIQQCTFFLLLLAPGDLDRCIIDSENDWILKEVTLAFQYNKIIIPVTIKEGFMFPQTDNEILQLLSRENICSLEGTNFVENVHNKLTNFMKCNPINALRKEYTDTIVDKKYLEWEKQTLKSIYHDVELVNIFGKDYSNFAIEGSTKLKYPFSELYDQKNLKNPEKELDYNNNDLYGEFSRIIGPTIHFPNLYGFTNEGFHLDNDGKILSFDARPRTYKETVFTTHILQYELYKAYKQLEGKRLATLDDLPLRKKIHQGSGNRDVILSGRNRSALCDVSMAVIYKEKDEYRIVYGQRSKNVSVYPGYLNIIPSGGFELYELEEFQTNDVIRDNFNVVSALFREYLEEMFGEKDYEQAEGNDDLHQLYRHEKITELIKGIEKNKIKFEFLGVAFDLIILRQTLCFALVIDDDKYVASFKKNEENDFVKTKGMNEFEDFIIHSEHPISTESASLFYLLKKNHIYKKLTTVNWKDKLSKVFKRN